MLADPTCQKVLPKTEQNNTTFPHQAKVCLPWYTMIGFGSVTAQYNCSTNPSSACSELEPARVRRTQASHGMLSIAFIRNTNQSQSKNESKHRRQGPAPSALQTNHTRQGTRHFSENRPRSQEPSKAVGVKAPSASSTTTATSLPGVSMFVQ